MYPYIALCSRNIYNYHCQLKIQLIFYIFGQEHLKVERRNGAQKSYDLHSLLGYQEVLEEPLYMCQQSPGIWF